MRFSGRLVAGVCAALAAVAFGAAIWLEARGEALPAPLDLVWIQPDAPEEGPPATEIEKLGLAPGDRLRRVRKTEQGWALQTRVPGLDPSPWAALPSLASLYADVLPRAKPVWICLSDRDLPDFPTRAQGVATFFSPEIGEEPSGWEFLGVGVPESIRAGRPFSLRWDAGTVRGATGRIRVWLDGGLVGEKPFSVFAGREKFDLPMAIPTAGTHEVRLEAVEGLAPQRPQSIAASVEVLPSPRLKILGEGNDISRWLETQGFLRDDSNLSSPSPDLVLVSRPLSASEIDGLEIVVRGGAGLLVFGGEFLSGLDGGNSPSWFPGKVRRTLGMPAAHRQSDGPFPESTSPPAPPSPAGEIVPAQREARESGVLALMLVLDKSGSMAGEKLERTLDAAVATAKTLDPKDWLGILGFDREVVELLPLGPVGDSADLRKRLDAVDAGGGTRIFPALKRGADELAAAPAAVRHLILLTDGATEDKVAKDAPYFEFMTEQAKRGLTLTTVGIRGGDYDSEFLSNLAVWGKGRFYPVDSDRIPQIFTLEARRVRSGAGTNPQPQPPDSNAGLFVRAKDLHPSLQGIDWEKPQSASPLGATNELLPEPWAAVPLTAGEKPLLAISHAGEGRVALWASWGSGPAIVDWMSDARAGQFWIQLAEYLRRRDPATSEFPHLRTEGVDLERRLRSREDRLRELGQMSARCGGELILDAKELSRALERQSMRTAPASLPWMALIGAALALLGMISLTRAET